jgi:hypothetical protein
MQEDETGYVFACLPCIRNLPGSIYFFLLSSDITSDYMHFTIVCICRSSAACTSAGCNNNPGGPSERAGKSNSTIHALSCPRRRRQKLIRRGRFLLNAIKAYTYVAETPFLLTAGRCASRRQDFAPISRGRIWRSLGLKCYPCLAAPTLKGTRRVDRAWRRPCGHPWCLRSSASREMTADRVHACMRRLRVPAICGLDRPPQL